MLESWKTLSRRSSEFKVGTATPVYASWLQEVMERGDLDDVLPSGAPEYMEAATAYSRCHWLGVGRGYVDETKEAGASIMRMDGGLSTLARECEQQGTDWEEILEQRAVELKMFKELDIPTPEWAGQLAAAEISKPREEPKPQ
jgi:capsid protein